MRLGPSKSARHSKTQHIIAAFVPALIVVLSITGFVWAQQRVTVVVDGSSRVIETQASEVGDALAQAGIVVGEDDLVSPAEDTPVTGGMTIVVRHATPVNLQFGEQKVPVDVVGETVADALVASGIDPSLNDSVKPSLETPLTRNMTIEVPDAFVRVLREEAQILPGTQRVKDGRLARGRTRTVDAGKPGRLLRVYRVTVTRGVETSPVLTAEHVISNPVPKVIAVGTAPVAVAASDASRSSNPGAGKARAIPKAPRAGRRFRVVATGYSAAQPGLDDWTATGAKARRGVIAVDPRVIALGTRVYVPGYGYAIAADTGGAVRGARIDLCFDTVAEAINWGRRNVTIIILD